MLRTRRPLLALLLLGVLLAGGYLLSYLGGDPGPARPATTSGPSSAGTATAAGPAVDRTPTPGRTIQPTGPGGTRSQGTADGPATVGVAELPAEARRVLALLDAGGPFPYRQDGSVFGNYERRLPAHPRGWYREYTVPTPGERDRGARRIVAGRDGTRYYTADHYESYARIRP